MIGKHGVVNVKAEMFNQNDFEAKWRMVNLAFTKSIQPKKFTLKPLSPSKTPK